MSGPRPSRRDFCVRGVACPAAFITSCRAAPNRGSGTPRCLVCSSDRRDISGFLRLCGPCASDGSSEAMDLISAAHRTSRARFNLPPSPPRAAGGLACGRCGNECLIPAGQKGFCGLSENRGGRLRRLTSPEAGILSAYYDPHPTNCVAAWVCAGGRGTGFPRYSVSSKGPEAGYANLSVFYGACPFDCLFCQNWHWRENTRDLGPRMSAERLASMVDEKVTCICFYGGDPAVQPEHVIAAARLARERKQELSRRTNCSPILRVCIESSGSFNSRHLETLARIASESGGGIKFDLKAWNDNLHLALTGVSNRATLANFKGLGQYHKQRPQVPFLRAATLLVPGYVDVQEVRQIAGFIAGIDPAIPYSLLAFSPQFELRDLPLTPRRLAQDCRAAAEAAGLKNVTVGNTHLLV